MAILKRNDGTPFVLHPYRETLTLKNSSLLRKEVRYLAEMQGAYVRLFKEGQTYEAIFAQSPGFLLGESLWNYLEKPRDFIYCELLPDKEKPYLLVVAREGKLYLDNQLSQEEFTDELLPLLAENTPRYLVYLFGDIPHVFEGPAIKTIHILEQSLFAHLNVDPIYQLLSVEQALEEHHLNVQKRSSIVLITFIFLLGLGGMWWWTWAHRPSNNVTPQINPYEQYELTLSTPAPTQQIAALVKGLAQIQTIPGWMASSFIYKQNRVIVTVQSLGGRATDLIAATQAQKMMTNFGSTGAQIGFMLDVPARPVPDKIANVQHMTAIIIDKMMQILPGSSVSIGKNTMNNVFNTTEITISFNNISPDILQLIGNNINDFSISLIGCSAQIRNGLLTGSLQLAVVGN